LTDHDLFDARQTLLCEGSRRPDDRWSTVSLVTAVRGLVSWTPADTLAWPRGSSPDSRLTAFQAVTGELTRRGVDAESLVRYGMRNEIAASLMSFLLIKALGLEIPELARQRSIDLDAWNAVLPNRKIQDLNLQISAENLSMIVNETAQYQVPLILPWIMRAPLKTLVTLSPPELPRLAESFLISPSDSELYQRYAWLVDRFSTTSLHDWLTSSLYCEYRWQAEQEPPPCPPVLMLDREISEERLNAEIARRAVLQVPNGEPDAESALAVDMAGHARALLLQGRGHEAAALFEFASKRRPADAEARNNLGFCLIPENPKQALWDLEAAARMGYDNTVVNVYNRVCCHSALRQARAAIALADGYWMGQDGPPIGAILWRRAPNGGWDIAEVADSRHALADLIVSIAVEEGLRDEERIWRHRLRERQEPAK
jgi:hypothetical protein